MKLTVVGWYGTETIGDRAIMAGIFHILSKVCDDIHLHFGALYVPLTERTLFEDKEYYNEISDGKLKSCNVFYSLDKGELERNVADSDLVIVGGGPLMDIHCMYMLKYAFNYAKKKGIKTALFGCGWGPLNEPKFIKVACDLIKLSDLVIFRDSASLNQALTYVVDNKQLYSLIDPAVIAGMYYKQHTEGNPLESHIAVNFREFFVCDTPGKGKFTYDDCANVLSQLLKCTDLPIKLIPMHTFYIGGDDRLVNNKVAQMIDSERIVVQNVPMSLKQTMDSYYNASLCVGMRFHAVLLQTVLNGRNYIMDYTESYNGKIKNLIDNLNLAEVYSSRYVGCLKANNLFDIDANVPKVEIQDNVIDNYFKRYVSLVGELLSCN